jgi:hypothetical protein
MLAYLFNIFALKTLSAFFGNEDSYFNQVALQNQREKTYEEHLSIQKTNVATYLEPGGEGWMNDLSEACIKCVEKSV